MSTTLQRALVTVCVLNFACGSLQVANRSTSQRRLALQGGTCANATTCLKLVDRFLDQQPHQTNLPAGVGMLQTFGHALPGGGGPCGALCQLQQSCPQRTSACRFYVYDNALAAIYYVHRGALDKAQGVLDAFIKYLYPHGKESLSLMASAYSATGQVVDYPVDAGVNAWAGMAFVHFANASGKACYAKVARAILNTIQSNYACDDELGGFMGRLSSRAGLYRSSEHNIDIFALANMLGDETAAAQAKKFVKSMCGFEPSRETVYATGTLGGTRCNAARDTHATDMAAGVQFWNILADLDPSAQCRVASVEKAMRPAAEGGLVVEDVDRIGDGATLTGIRFTSAGNGAQWENSASAVMALARFQKQNGGIETYNSTASKIRESLLHQLGEYGVVLASVLGGNYDAWSKHDHNMPYPGGSDTGIGWTYMRYPHTAATAWTGLLLLDVNPFQSRLSDEVVSSITSSVDDTCLPK